MQKQELFFIKDLYVSSCILAVLGTQTLDYARSVNKSRPKRNPETKKMVYEKVEKHYKRTRYKCISGTNGKEGARYTYRELIPIDPLTFVKMFTKQCPAFQKMFQQEYLEMKSQNNSVI